MRLQFRGCELDSLVGLNREIELHIKIVYDFIAWECNFVGSLESLEIADKQLAL